MDGTVLNQAAICAALASYVYSPKEEMLAKVTQLGSVSDFEFFKHDGTEAACFILGDRNYIVFRGTEPNKFKDIQADLRAWRVKSDTVGKVHFGFKESLDDVWPNIAKWIESSKNNPLVVCGHSLGGALATLAGSRIKDCTVYTFGSPRVGNRTWCKDQTFTHYRFVNNNDIVTKVPFFLLGFKHYGNLCYINHYGNIRKPTAWQKFKDGWRGRSAALKKFQLFDGIYDHSMTKYKNKIEHVLRSNS